MGKIEFEEFNFLNKRLRPVDAPVPKPGFFFVSVIMTTFHPDDLFGSELIIETCVYMYICNKKICTMFNYRFLTLRFFCVFLIAPLW